MEFKLMRGDVIEKLKELPDKSINTCVTSPPYYGLRDYGTGKWIGGDPDCPHYRTSKRSDLTSTGHANMVDSGHPVGDAIYKTVCPLCGAVRVDGQIGLEESPEEYINKLVDVFREVKRVLRDDGILWVNIGDSYVSKPKSNYDGKAPSFNDRSYGTGNTTPGYRQSADRYKGLLCTYKNKDLIGIPWMLAFALRADGWYLRQDIIWAKNNPMPESVKDRCTRSHEYIFMLTKSRKYWFDHEAMQEDTDPKYAKRYNKPFMDKAEQNYPHPQGGHNTGGMKKYNGKRNKRDVWNVSVCSTVKEAHFAVFPKDLVEPCILAGCPEGGVVLDPFNGSGTTGIVATNNNRNYIGIDLNPEYIEITKRRVEKECTNVFIAEVDL